MITPWAWIRKRRYVGEHRTPEEVPYTDTDTEDTIMFFREVKEPAEHRDQLG